MLDTLYHDRQAMSPTPPDDVLHRRYLSGDKAAARKLIQRHYSEILGFFQRRNFAEAEDLAQAVFETYVKAPEKITSANLRAFFYGVARNKLRHAIRRSTRRPIIDGDLSISVLVASGPGVSSIVSDRAEVHKMLAALQSLPVEHQTLMELLFKGFLMRDIAEILGVNENTCKTWKRRATKALHGKFGELRLTLREAAIALHDLDLPLRAGVLDEVLGEDPEKE